jgi:hypothetical protein
VFDINEKCFELEVGPSQTEPEYEPVAAEELHGGGVFGQPYRVVEGSQKNAGIDRHVAGGCGKRSADH